MYKQHLKFEPKIEYSIVKWERQTGPDCVFYATTRIIEKLAWLKHRDNVEFEAKELAEDFRDVLQDHEGGVSFVGFLKQLRSCGWNGYTFHFRVHFFRSFEKMLAKLAAQPLLLNFKTYEKKADRVDANGFYKLYPANTPRRGSHAVCIWGWDGENLLILDSHYRELIKLSEEGFKQLVNYVYSLSMY